VKPSDVTVLSEKVEPVPSLEGDLGPEESLLVGGTSLAPDAAFTSSTLVDLFAPRAEADPVFFTSVRRGGEVFCPSGAFEPRRLSDGRGSSSDICAIAAANGGRFELVDRRPRVTLSLGWWSSERRLPALIVAATARVPGELSRLDASRLDAVRRSSGGGAALGSTGDARDDASRARGDVGCFGLVFERELLLPGIDTCGVGLASATGDLGGVPSCGFSLVLGEA
jgi:hypothetical protein